MKLQKRFLWINFIALMAISGLIWLRDTDTNWITYSGSYFIAIVILSSFLYQVRPLISIKKHQVLSLLIFVLLFYLLQGVSVIVLSRFFRMEEVYTLPNFSAYLYDHGYFWIDGMLWWGFYEMIFFLISSKIHIDSLTEINKLQSSEINQIHKKQLRNELNPHFLFNTMNSITMKIRLNENKNAVNMIAALNDLLRASFKASEKELITVEEELDLLDKYLYIERQRFDEDQTQLSFSEEAKKQLIPELLLQPIVENAFKHSRMQVSSKPKVSVIGEVIEDQLIITVFNTSQASRSL